MGHSHPFPIVNCDFLLDGNLFTTYDAYVMRVDPNSWPPTFGAFEPCFRKSTFGGISWDLQWDFIVIQWDMNGIYPLVNVYIEIKEHGSLAVDLPIPNGAFPVRFLYVYQRVIWLVYDGFANIILS